MPTDTDQRAGNAGGSKAKLRVLDLFSGAGAYSLGLERTGGFETVAFCEIEPYPRKILRKHWPDVRIYEDVRALTGARLRDDGIVPDWIVAGWPCQDISVAGSGHGLDGARSGLWGEIARLAGELRPEGLLLENSSNLLAINGGADFGRVLGDLAALGFYVEWHCLPAAAFDAPHIRDRLWIVAVRADADSAGCEQRRRAQSVRAEQLAYARSDGRNARRTSDAPQESERRQSGGSGQRIHLAHANKFAPIGSAIARAERHSWEPEPGVGRVVAGCADRVDRLSALGNLNPPIIPETIGRAILTSRSAA